MLMDYYCLNLKGQDRYKARPKRISKAVKYTQIDSKNLEIEICENMTIQNDSRNKISQSISLLSV